jgi:FAD dependent oxidoreductase
VKKATVIGGGVFGCVIAIDLAHAGYQVALHEERYGILDGAVARCQARLHSGYHYPRSDRTAIAAQHDAAVFRQRFPQAVRSTQHYYVIAPGSKTSPDDYTAFCDRVGLSYEVVEKPPQVHTAELCLRVPEAFVDLAILRRILHREMAAADVILSIGHRVDTPPPADVVIWATYGQPWHEPLQYELCEVALVQLGRYGDDSFVVMDGEFVSLDPYDHGTYMLYDVKHSVHVTNVGMKPDVPPEYKSLLNALGPRLTKLSYVDTMRKSASRFLWGLDNGGQGVSIYAGSLFSVRAVLPNVDATDERPTLIHQEGNSISVLSGKICAAATVSEKVLALL